MGIRILIRFLIIYLACVDDAFSGCPDGKSLCEWLNWNPWTPCSRTCGGGTRSRYRGMCCKTSLVDKWPACVYDCEKNVDDSRDSSSCGDACFNGGTLVSDSSSWTGLRCLCTYLFTGTCCDEKHPVDTVIIEKGLSLIGAIVGGVGLLCLAAVVIIVVVQQIVLRRRRSRKTEQRVATPTNEGQDENNYESMAMSEIPVYDVVQTQGDKDVNQAEAQYVNLSLNTS